MEKTYRKELKYLLSYAEYVALQRRVDAIMHRDSHMKNGKYHIRSVYFDDFKNTDYYEKLAGVENRKKYRLRFYDYDSSFIRMEKKVKHNQSSYKRSASVTYETAQKMLLGDFSDLFGTGDALLEEIYMYNRTRILRPTVITDYDRQAYVCRAGNVRLTFDSRLKTSLLSTRAFERNLPMVPAMGLDQIILEVKYDHFLPEIIRDILRNITAQNLAISKFALCKKYIALNDWEVL